MFSERELPNGRGVESKRCADTKQTATMIGRHQIIQLGAPAQSEGASSVGGCPTG